LHMSVEGAEDNTEQGKMSVVERGVTSNDVVCGIAASGRTPFVLSALDHAKEIGAKTMLLTCNPNRSNKGAYDVEIDLPTGPELITGSTRLKAGTATKIVLNILSTCAMVHIGKTQGNMMVAMRASNSKLRTRAISTVSRLKEISRDEAERRLIAGSWNLQSVLND
jgi:N-acetylmuramic acid 6-phosphate etherase